VKLAFVCSEFCPFLLCATGATASLSIFAISSSLKYMLALVIKHQNTAK